jgi:hypothetical protein
VRVTFKLRPRETGLRAVGAGPRSSEIRVDGIRVGGISARGGEFGRPVRGWFFHANYLGAYVNTCDAPVATEAEAKTAAKAWIVARAEASR